MDLVWYGSSQWAGVWNRQMVPMDNLLGSQERDRLLDGDANGRVLFGFVDCRAEIVRVSVRLLHSRRAVRTTPLCILIVNIATYSPS